MSGGRLLLAATPLGQPDDASARLIEALGSADIVAAEDTRRVRSLAQSLGVRIAGRVVSLFDQNEATRVPALVEELRAGATVLAVTDAGMPSISDPGYRLVVACVAADAPLTCLPGPSAVTTALTVSGLPADRFCFEGFAPRKQAARRAWLGVAGRRAAHLRVLRIAPAAARNACVTPSTNSAADRRARGLPGTDQDPRGGRPRHAGRARPVGGRRCARRDHRRARGRDAQRRHRHPGGRGRPR